ncbi:MAG TPA: hypothetical protein VHD33_06160, partial [Legionellaceae bacterium]|nr:hypothetical protein [Legionellaceae bacterium]
MIICGSSDALSQTSEDNELFVDQSDDSEALFSLTADTPTESVDEDDFEFQPVGDDDDEDETPTGTQNIGTCSAMPSWLGAAYVQLKNRLQKETANKQLPLCYRDQSFVISRNPFFEARTAAILSPEIYYQPIFYLWHPHHFVERIPCPGCIKSGRKNIYLQKHSWPKQPRRVTDIKSSIYIVGFRYRCVHEECKRIYKSWSPAILEVLPPSVSKQFNFHLTYRGDISQSLALLLRELFQHGYGPEPFTEMIRAMHYHNFDTLQAQYLQFVVDRLKNPNPFSIGASYSPFGTFLDVNGFAGHIPSPQYFRRIYDTMIEQQAPEMRQQVAMLSARTLSVDHSFKVPKHLGKVNSVPIFNALHTSVNEYGEVRQMLLTATKAHDQIMPTLSYVPKSLHMFGHTAPEVIFTDNVNTDKHAFESIFPSLKDNSIPVIDTTHLPQFALDSDWAIALFTSDFQINATLNTILKSIDSSNP